MNKLSEAIKRMAINMILGQLEKGSEQVHLSWEAWQGILTEVA